MKALRVLLFMNRHFGLITTLTFAMRTFARAGETRTDLMVNLFRTRRTVCALANSASPGNGLALTVTEMPNQPYRMSASSHEDHKIAAPLACRVGQAADAAQIAAAVFAIWEEIDDSLTPILGSRGVAALYQRSLHLAAAGHAWLEAADEGDPPAVGPAALKSALARQSSAVAAVGGNAFLQTLHDLLASLIGPSLTERLLRTTWENSLGSPPPQDISP
jgi:hypothetical protein